MFKRIKEAVTQFAMNNVPSHIQKQVAQDEMNRQMAVARFGVSGYTWNQGSKDPKNREWQAIDFEGNPLSPPLKNDDYIDNFRRYDALASEFFKERHSFYSQAQQERIVQERMQPRSEQDIRELWNSALSGDTNKAQRLQSRNHVDMNPSSSDRDPIMSVQPGTYAMVDGKLQAVTLASPVASGLIGQLSKPVNEEGVSHKPPAPR